MEEWTLFHIPRVTASLTLRAAEGVFVFLHQELCRLTVSERLPPKHDAFCKHSKVVMVWSALAFTLTGGEEM